MNKGFFYNFEMSGVLMNNNFILYILFIDIFEIIFDLYLRYKKSGILVLKNLKIFMILGYNLS